MWIILGFSAIITMLINLALWSDGKNSEIFRFLSISLTALTVCDFYNMSAASVIAEDWGGLMDVVPITSKALWIFVIASIIINSFSILKKKSAKNNY